ncbi:M48 family metallopeptidase [Corynebacterium sp. HS2168-gen11]|uniref:M48 family metallopeptidase n=1 Tax=Corynebacterium sp. HS2168-gen11 TaxID=2974027 RepID=UPI00216B0204|nr:M48 family metallopeptidase [Corynebacterium sp. HS2168-gen11]MCS4536124.1 M48 family metallopeptidase [Corynebacterium sp. HS2168-gen11]
MTNLPQQTPTAGPSIKELRHWAEMPFIWLGIILTAIAVASVFILLSVGAELDEDAALIMTALLIPIFAGVVLVRHMYWTKITNSVEMNEHQFPEAYKIYLDVATRMGFGGEGNPPVPRLYLENGMGGMNAFAAKCNFSDKYVVITSDLMDLAYAHGDFDILEFVFAHELGHVKCGHVNLWRLAVNPVMTLVRLQATMTRATEYTADRCASYYVEPHKAMGMIGLYAGKNMSHRVDIDEYFASIENHKDSWWIVVANFLADHAVGWRRMQTLKRCIDEKTWDIHGKML